jgi:hypothetical protein
MRQRWSPFTRKGKLRLTLSTDPWWKRTCARLRGRPLWHKVGALASGDCWHQWTTGTGPDDPADTGIHTCVLATGHTPETHHCRCGQQAGT